MKRQVLDINKWPNSEKVTVWSPGHLSKSEHNPSLDQELSDFTAQIPNPGGVKECANLLCFLVLGSHLPVTAGLLSGTFFPQGLCV